MTAVKEACAREKITVAILPKTMRASYYLAESEKKPIETPIKEDLDENETDAAELQGKSEEQEAIERGEDPSTGWPCLHQRSKRLRWCTIEHHEQCITCFIEERMFAYTSLFQNCRDIFSDVKAEIEKKYEKERAQHAKEVEDKEEKPDILGPKETTSPTVPQIAVKIPEPNAETPKVQSVSHSVLDQGIPSATQDVNTDELQEAQFIKTMRDSLQVRARKGQQTLGDSPLKKPKENSE